jgi:hypothetical protein
MKNKSSEIENLLNNNSTPIGNPHAKEQICKINEQKKDNAMMYAMLLQPIILHCNNANLSQRNIVLQLNNQRIHAPEGGNWVLSQLQKVLKRIKFITIIYKLDQINTKWHNNTNDEIKNLLCNANIEDPNKKQWDNNSIIFLLNLQNRMANVLAFNDALIENLPKINNLNSAGTNIEQLNDDKHINSHLHIRDQVSEILALEQLFLKNPKFGPHLIPSKQNPVLNPKATTLIAQIQEISEGASSISIKTQI